MTDIVHTFLHRRVMVVAMALVVLPALVSACADETSGNRQGEDPAMAAHVALHLWGASRGVQVRDVSARTLTVDGDRATAVIEAGVRNASSEDWQRLSITVPVRRDQSGAWHVMPVSVVDRLVRASRQATAVAEIQAIPSPTAVQVVQRATATATALDRPTPPPPPTGSVIYESDWSEGLDGWIGTPDWQAVDGLLVNDGTRSERDLWLEAPVTVEPWQSMIVEFQVDAPVADFGSFGLVARGGGAGWYEIGLRWEDFARGSGTPVVTVGAAIRQETRRVREEMFAVRHPLTSAPHLYRVEFRDGVVRFFVDGDETGTIPEGSFVPGEFIGLWSERTPLRVHYFRVTLV